MMSEIRLEENAGGRSTFVIEQNNERVAEMQFSVHDGTMTVYHTEVSDALKGQGVGSRLLAHMVDYARENKRKVIALCPFVSAHFKRHPEKYQDIWIRNSSVK